jgi:hypothetical protein
METGAAKVTPSSSERVYITRATTAPGLFGSITWATSSQAAWTTPAPSTSTAHPQLNMSF